MDEHEKNTKQSLQGDGEDSKMSTPGLDAIVKTGDSSISVDLSSVPVKVVNVTFDGLGRTKRDFLQKSINDLFVANNFEQLILKIGQAQQKLKALGVFKDVGTLVDTAKEGDVSPDAYEVTFLVKELKIINGGVSGMVGSNEGIAQAGISCPNMFGRGEKLSFDHYCSSSSGKRSEVSFAVPFPYIGSMVSYSIFASRSPNSFSAVNTSSIGTQVKYDFNLRKYEICSAQWQGIWRHLSALNNPLPSFPIREYFGHSIKSAVRLVYSRDDRDQPIFPNHGTLRKISVDLAGISGDAKFMKVETDLQYNQALFKNGTILQGSLRGGLLQPLSYSQMSYDINDLFFLGGPSSLRGFAMRGVGPRCQQNALGGKVVWSSALHLYAPLPLVNNKFPFTENIRFHGFLNVGSIGQTASECRDANNIRGSSGFGLAYRFGRSARLEINYCYPFKFARKDRCVNGFQFGFGVDFL